MTELENMEAIELTAEEMNEIAGGAFKKPAEKKGYIIYQIKPRDTLIKIAQRYGCTYKDIMAWNPKITNKNLIRSGDYLYIKK